MSPELQAVVYPLVTAVLGLLGYDRYRVAKKHRSLSSDDAEQRKRFDQLVAWAKVAQAQLKKCEDDRKADAAERAAEQKEHGRQVRVFEQRISALERDRIDGLREIHDLQEEMKSLAARPGQFAGERRPSPSRKKPPVEAT